MYAAGVVAAVTGSVTSTGSILMIKSAPRHITSGLKTFACGECTVFLKILYSLNLSS